MTQEISQPHLNPDKVMEHLTPEVIYKHVE